MRALIALLVLLGASPLSAQLQPIPGEGDPRLQTVQYAPNAIVRLSVAPGNSLAVIFSSSERILNVAVGDSGAWQVSVAQGGDSLFVKPLQDGVITNMTVLTDARTYSFELQPASGMDSAYVVRFTYPSLSPPSPPSEPAELAVVGEYRVSGDANLRPLEIGDDGMRTYIRWGEDQTLPAVFAVGAGGREEVADGYMRQGLYTIDRVHPKLVFRIDRKSATARRREVRQP